MEVYKQIFISGQVQGVFFRDSAQQKANELNLYGGVRNRRDGRVEILVSGDMVVVETLINWLKIGPKLAKVTTIEVVNLSVSDYDAVCLQKVAQKRGVKFDVWPTK